MRANILTKLYSKTTKDKRVCKKCNHSNAFFKLECEDCSQKFTKTRAERGGISAGERSTGTRGTSTTSGQNGGNNSLTNLLNTFNHQGMNTENYSVYFWELLQSNNEIFGQHIAQKVCEHLDESDFMSVRDLYKKIKELLSQENTERIYELTDTN